MALKADLQSSVNDILTAAWDSRDGTVVPETDDVKLSNGMVKLEAVYLYADLADSTTLARDFDKRTGARVVRAYLSVMSTLVRKQGGEIRSFDGDRVMGIFVGDQKNTNAAICALKMKWALLNILRPKIEAKYPSLQEAGYTLEHTAGLDRGEVRIVRAGVRNSNDLISIGSAPNVAAALSDRRNAPYRSYITKSVYDAMLDKAKFSSTKREPMWEARTFNLKNKTIDIYRSSWGWVIS